MVHTHATLKDTVRHGDISKVAAAFGPELEVNAGRPENAVVDRNVFGSAAYAQCFAGLENNGVVDGFDETVRNADMARTVGVDSIGESVLNRYSVDGRELATAQTYVVTRGVPNRDFANTHMTAPPQGDRL